MNKMSLAAGVALAVLAWPALAQTAPSDTPSKADTPGRSGPDRGDIVVTAAPFATESDNTPAIVATVDRKEIRNNGGSSIADSLADVPGISGTGFAPGASRPVIRGMDASRVRIVENGSSSSDVSDIGPDHGIPIDPLAARRIEVVRGAATLRYGGQAIGGVVNVINDRVPTSLPANPFSGELNGSYGTVANTAEGSALADLRSGDFAFHVDGFYRHTDDYDTPLGTQANSFFRGYGGSLGGSYFFGSGNSRIGGAIQQYNAKYGIPSDDTYIDLKQTKVLGRSSFDLGSGAVRTLNIDASYADYKHSEDEPDGTILSTFLNKEFDGRAELLFAPTRFLSNSAIGIEIQRRRFSALGEDSSYLFPTLTQTEAGYAFAEVRATPALLFQASGRVEQVHVEGTPVSDVFTRIGFTPVSGALGALLDVGGGLKLGLNFSSTGRAPAITELFARGGHDGPQTYETGDPALRMERANSIEGTVRFNSGAFRFEGSAYHTWFRNYIYGDLTGRTCDDDGNCTVGFDNELKELNYRQQGARFWGLEGQATYKFYTSGSGSLEVKVLADYTRAKLDDGNNVPRIPPYRVGGGLSWESTMFDAGVLFIHSGRQDKFGIFDTPTPGYDQLKAQASLRPFTTYPGIEFAIVGQNLTDDVQRDAAALNKDQVVRPGRDIRFIVRVATF
ncbi:TonB-dependent receptor [uncultured Sphingomonas sp.]|uniref:TonB-dependent receptor n=1 Tax=uncultured Sphingomonas sp. TaxID=158754 RepID=UPI0035CA652E